MHLFLRRRVVQQLNQVIAKHHLAWRQGEVAADLEHGLVGHRNVALLDVVLQVFDAELKALALGFNGAFDGLGIGQKEIARRHRIEHLFEKKFRSVPLFFFKVGMGHQLTPIRRRAQILVTCGLKKRLRLPRRRAKTTISGGQCRHVRFG